MRTIIKVLEAVLRLAVRLSVMSALDPNMQCPGCVVSDRYFDANKRPRLKHRPASIVVKLGSGAVVLACVGHAPLVKGYSLRDRDGRVIR